MEERTLESTYVYRGTILDLRTDKVSLPDGKTALREIIVHNGAVGILPVFPSGNILLVKQFRKAAESVTLEIPAGKLEGNEDKQQCVVRELKEETGFTAHTIKHLLSFYPAIGYSTEVLYIYLALELEAGQQRLEEDENIELVELSLKEGLDKISNGEIIDSKTIIALYHYARNISLKSNLK